MRVALMMDQLDALGGVQRVMRVLGDGLTDRGIDVELIGLHPADSGRRMASVHALPELVLHDSDPGPLYSPMTGWQRAKLAVRGQRAGVRAFDDGARRLARHVARHPDVVVVAMQLRSAEYAVRAGIDPARLLVQYHDSREAARLHGDIARLRRIAPRAGDVLVLNAGDAAAFADDGIRAGVLPNPIDLAHIVPPSTPREPVVVMGARYEPQKALDVAIRAWAIVGRRHPQWELRIFGEGSERAALERLIVATGARARVMGPTDDFSAQLVSARVHALSSRHEGMGLVIAEAMCAGTPTAATDCGAGVRELVVDGRTGLLSPVGDVDAFAASLERLISDDDLRLSLAERAQEHVRRFDADTVLTTWADRLRAIPR